MPVDGGRHSQELVDAHSVVEVQVKGNRRMFVGLLAGSEEERNFIVQKALGFQEHAHCCHDGRRTPTRSL